MSATIGGVLTQQRGWGDIGRTSAFRMHLTLFISLPHIQLQTVAM